MSWYFPVLKNDEHGLSTKVLWNIKVSRIVLFCDLIESNKPEAVSDSKSISKSLQIVSQITDLAQCGYFESLYRISNIWKEY